MTTKVTCITVCRNDKNGLLATMKSALSQTQPLYEVVVVDGASIDGTTDELPKLKNEFESKGIQFQYISEPDAGIYDAMNKGIKMSTGKWLIFMNAGDLFAGKNVLKDFFEKSVDDEIGVLYGDYYKESKGQLISRKSRPINTIGKQWHTCHQAVFTKAELMKKRPYDVNYPICADYAWFLKYYQEGGHFEHRNVFVCISTLGGVSTQKLYPCFSETMKVRCDFGTGDSKAIIMLKSLIIITCDRISFIRNMINEVL